jgi:hypothetical protein
MPKTLPTPGTLVGLEHAIFCSGSGRYDYYATPHWLCTSLNMYSVAARVARWYIFKPKIPIWVNFGVSYNGRCWYSSWPFGTNNLWPFGMLCDHFVYFSRFGTYVVGTSKNLATLVSARIVQSLLLVYLSTIKYSCVFLTHVLFQFFHLFFSNSQ